MKYAVTLPNWSEGKPLRIENIEAEGPDAAATEVVERVNRYAAGLMNYFRKRPYCTRLPAGAKVEEMG